jgi:rubredoxin
LSGREILYWKIFEALLEIINKKFGKVFKISFPILYKYTCSIYNWRKEIQRKKPVDEIKGGTNMEKYVCTVCGYIYDEGEGDPDNGIAAGTKWENVPEDFVCPLCGVGKDQFEKE